MKMNFALGISTAALAGAVLATPSFAQTVPPAPQPAQQVAPESNSLIADVVVTAQKRGVAEAGQDVPIAITAISGEQLDEAHVTNLEGLTLAAPNVALESNGTARGVANFTIRGLAVNSTITSLEPTVGTFVDGVYIGTNVGVITDVFDLESIEVLRGPQGTLFGRNVTGGAVLLRTARPGKTFQAKFQAGVETGPAYRTAASVGGPVAGDTVRAKLTASYSNDDGWFFNRFTGRQFGSNETFVIRPVVVIEPTSNVDTTLIYEHGKTTGQGSPFRNLLDNLPYTDINSNYDGYFNLKWNSLTSETNIGVGLGDGTITNVFGWRQVRQRSGNDVDGTPFTLFHLFNALDQRQFSNELRYAGTFGVWRPTVGLFYFNQAYTSVDAREVSPTQRLAGGGRIEQESYAIFANSDFEVTNALTFSAGLRYSYETKSARITRTAGSNCDLASRVCDFTTPGALIDKDNWSSLSPKVGISWKAQEGILAYASFSQATRSGGYNLRRTSPLDPGKFDQEKMTAYEVGAKTDLFDRKVRLNVAAFYNTVANIQRDIVLPGTLFGGTTGVVQLITNAADVDLYGGEVEFQLSPNRHWLFNASAGYTGDQYKNVIYDLNGDGVVNSTDRGLSLPRLAPWSYSVGLSYNHDIDGGNLRASTNYAYRDRAPLNEANTLFFQTQKQLDFDVSFSSSGDRFSISFYAKNMLNHITGGSGSILVQPGVNPSLPRGVTFQTVDRGRVIGGQLRIKM